MPFAEKLAAYNVRKALEKGKKPPRSSERILNRAEANQNARADRARLDELNPTQPPLEASALLTPAKPDMVRYQYKVETFRMAGAMQLKLNSLGKRGWEVVSTTAAPHFLAQTIYKVTLRRARK